MEKLSLEEAIRIVQSLVTKNTNDESYKKGFNDALYMIFEILNKAKLDKNNKVH